MHAFSSHATDSSDTVARLSMALLDHVGCGLILCDANGDTRFINNAARQELAQAQLLRLMGRQVLRATGTGGDLAGALRQAATRGRRSLVQLARGNDRLLATTVPIRLPGEMTPLVLIVLGRRHACSELELEMLASHHGLTLAERRVLAALLREAKPREIADAHAVKMSTVRTQINSIRAKLGTRSVEGLLLRAAEMPPVASAVQWAG